MSRHDAETLLRDTFLSHEAEADGGAADLTGAVRARVARRRRRARVAGIGAAAVAVLVAAGVVPALTGDRPARPPAVDVAAEDRAATAGWRWESSLGAEIQVPAHWTVNDSGCRMTGAPTVVRGGGPAPSCWTAEPVHKELAFLGERPNAVPPPQRPGGEPVAVTLAERAVEVGGVPAVRAEGRLPDGRYAGTVTVSARQVAVSVRTRDEATTRRILDSLRLVETDHAGCATRPLAVAPAPLSEQSSSGRPTTRTAEDQRRTPFVPSVPSSISVCSYGSLTRHGERRGRLEASARLTGAEAVALAAALNAARPGGNPVPAGVACVRPDPYGYEALLLVRDRGDETRVRVNWNGCTRGLDNGASRTRLTMSLLAEIMGPVKTGYSLSHELPR
ncbi:hypothetical protein V6U77_16460 [Micromonospora sp. CPCC 205546]|uniref:hypothetical protein n=1 Tax=Micromonospora sp. CPCC 205546 TaxID=3122397 RepID=UPI002FF21A2F